MSDIVIFSKAWTLFKSNRPNEAEDILPTILSVCEEMVAEKTTPENLVSQIQRHERYGDLIAFFERNKEYFQLEDPQKIALFVRTVCHIETVRGVR